VPEHVVGAHSKSAPGVVPYCSCVPARLSKAQYTNPPALACLLERYAGSLSQRLRRSVRRHSG
jgi:hypothetical protein